MSIFCRDLFPGRLDAHETTESENSADSQKQREQESEFVSKSDGTSSEGKFGENLDKETHSEKTDVSERTLEKDHEESDKTSKSESPVSQKDVRKEITPRTAVEDVLPSEEEEKKSTSEEIKSKSKTKSGTVKRRPSFDDRRSKSSSSKSDESPKKSGGTHRRKEFVKKRELSAKKVSMKITEKMDKEVAKETSEVGKKAEETDVQTKETSNTLIKTGSKESPDRKGQTRRKSVEFSSSKDSALMEDSEDRSLSADTSTAVKRKMSDEGETVRDLSPTKSNLEVEKEEDETKKVKKHSGQSDLGTGEY